jgi:hypothetical protein
MRIDQRWAVNRAFLNAVVRRGDAFLLATHPARATGTYLQELLYLYSRGYHPVFKYGYWWMTR